MSVVRLVLVSKVIVGVDSKVDEDSVGLTVEDITSGSKEGDRRSILEDTSGITSSERVTTRLFVSSTVV